MLRPTLEKLSRFGFYLPDKIRVHLDAGYHSRGTQDLPAELGCDAVISQRGFPLQAGKRWVVKRLNSWHNRGFKKLLVCAERRARVIEAFIAMANAIIVIQPLVRVAWTTHRWDTRPAHQVTYPRDL